MYRTHTCGCLRADDVNRTVTLAGWVQKVRNLGAMTFIDLSLIHISEPTRH